MASHPYDAVTALVAAAAIEAAQSSGLLLAVEQRGPIAIDELVARTHLDREGVELVVGALARLGVVAVEHDRVAIVGSAEGWRTLSSIGGQVHALLEGIAGEGSSAPSDYRSVAELLGAMTRSVIGTWARSRAKPGLRLLEVGCGDAPWTRALAEVTPAFCVTLVDHPEVLDATLERLREDHSDVGIDARPGDAHSLDLGGPYDVVVVSGFCRLFDADTNARLFRRLASTIHRGGELLVLDAVELDDPAALALYRLSLASRRAGGRPYPIGCYRRWFDDAGFDAPEINRSDRPELTLLSTHLRGNAPAQIDPHPAMRQDERKAKACP